VTYIVFGGTLNLAQSITIKITIIGDKPNNFLTKLFLYEKLNKELRTHTPCLKNVVTVTVTEALVLRPLLED